MQHISPSALILEFICFYAARASSFCYTRRFLRTMPFLAALRRRHFLRAGAASKANTIPFRRNYSHAFGRSGFSRGRAAISFCRSWQNFTLCYGNFPSRIIPAPSKMRFHVTTLVPFCTELLALLPQTYVSIACFHAASMLLHIHADAVSR